MRYPPRVERLNHRLGLTVDFIELPLKDTHVAPALDPQNPLANGTYRSFATSEDPSDNPVV
jgi:hypothetical protein